MPSRDDILLRYLEQLPYPPYPVQEEALYAWAESNQGVLLSAPTGTGKTLVAEGAVYEALHSDTFLYYSTPLIALTDQKFIELQTLVAGWGFARERVGLVTGHRTINPNAQVKVVVAEVLLNRLLHQEVFDFAAVGAVVMDEFHSFNDAQRGIVWELSLSLLPKHTRLMLLSATVGAPQEFMGWLARALGRHLTLVVGKERKVPLHFHWVGDELLPDFLERVARGSGNSGGSDARWLAGSASDGLGSCKGVAGSGDTGRKPGATSGGDSLRKTPALVFCFDREVCWATAEVLKGKDLFAPGQRQALLDCLEAFDFGGGAGAKLRTVLARGVGVHHAGLLPRYRRVVETLFQEKLLPVCVCTETLAAGINLPARSVVLTTLVKGPRDKKRIIEAGAAQQMFGRAGRPQFDTEGHVFALAHEDDVKLARWQEKFDSIPEDAKDPKLMAAKKALGKKRPVRRQGVTYWNAEQFAKLQTAAPAKLASKGSLTWRWLAYLLDVAPAIEPIRQVIRRRLMDSAVVQAELKRLTHMLVTLHELGMAVLEPAPPESWRQAVKAAGGQTPGPGAPGVPRLGLAGSASDGLAAAAGGTDDESDDDAAKPAETDFSNEQDVNRLLGRLKLGNAAPPPSAAAALAAEMAMIKSEKPAGGGEKTPGGSPVPREGGAALPDVYEPVTATPTAKLKDMMVFRAVHPLYGVFLMDYLGLADRHELVQILESLLEMPGSVAKYARVPWPDELPPGRLSLDVVDPGVIAAGLASQDDLYPQGDQSDLPPEQRKYPIPLAQKMRMLFESKVAHAGGLFITPVWAVGELVAMGGDFEKYVRARDLVKQEGILFKHALRMILLCGEFAQLTPAGITAEAWKGTLDELAGMLTAGCRAVDPQSTDELLEEVAEA